MSEENKAVVRRYIEEVLNQGNLDTVDEVFTTDYVYHGRPEDPSDAEGAKKMAIRAHNAFPDLHITIEDQIAEVDKVATRWTSTGTSKGSYDKIGPSGKKVRWSAIFIHRLEEGKIAEGWVVTDRLGMVSHMGVAPNHGPDHT